MSTPEQMRQMLNPQNMQAMIQMQQAVQQLQGSGLGPPGAGGLPGLGGAGGDMAGLAALLGGGGGGGFGGLGGGGGGVPPVADPETAYASQLTQLQVGIKSTFHKVIVEDLNKCLLVCCSLITLICRKVVPVSSPCSEQVAHTKKRTVQRAAFCIDHWVLCAYGAIEAFTS